MAQARRIRKDSLSIMFCFKRTPMVISDRKGITLMNCWPLSRLLGSWQSPFVYSIYDSGPLACKNCIEQLELPEMRRAEHGSYSNDRAVLLGRTYWNCGRLYDHVTATATTFTGTATPNTARQLKDTTPNALTINHEGTKLPADKWLK
jgi:hypothetical protein